MRYLAAVPVILLFAILDLCLIVSIFGMFLVADDRQFPVSYNFAKGVWK